MLDSILKTKLYLPPSHAGMVLRPRLVGRLESGRNRKLTLVSAPAGFGKTTLLGEWLSSTHCPFVWISLDENDNDPARFLMYLVSALRQLDPEIGAGILAAIKSIQVGTSQTPPESRLTELINEIDEIQESFVLVLDDYHIIHTPAIHEMLGFLIAHQPGNIHLVISGRADPPWPLARMRACSEVSELRTSDLRFTPAEAADFLNEVMDLNLTPRQVETLETCTEGWIVGLQMAAISMQGRSDVSGFIEAFTGSHRFIADFLLEEVLLRQPPEILQFLLKTSILERICAALADAVIGSPSESPSTSSQAILGYLEHSNLFLVPLDDERHWYRYHHLFRDLLRGNLLSSQPSEVHQLHLKASRWFANALLFEEAISHAFASQDFIWTADLIEQAALQIDIQNKQVVIAGWIEQLPEALVAKRPWLCVYRAWGQYWTGHREQVEASLVAAEKALEENHLSGSTRIDQKGATVLAPDAIDHIRGHIAAIHAHSALTGQNIPRVLEMGEKALALLPKGDEFRSETGIALGGAYWALGDVHRSEMAFASARSDALLCGRASMAVPSSCYLAMQMTKQGRFDEAMAIYRDALKLATTAEGKETPVAGFPNSRLGDLLRERNELDQAQQHLQRGVVQCEQLGQADVLADSYTCQARLQITLGDLHGATENLKKAVAVVENTKVDPFVVCWLDECRIRLWLKEGKLEKARDRLAVQGLAVDSPISYHYDLNHINLAKVLVSSYQQHPSKHDLEQTMTLLDRLLEAATKAGWTHEGIKCLVLKALILQAAKSEDSAVLTLVEALHQASPGSYIRTFIDEGDAMKSLLEDTGRKVSADPYLSPYLSKLIASFPDAQDHAPGLERLESHPLACPKPSLVEALSEREKGT